MQDARLFVDGKNAFPAILDDIQEAKESLYINMFIWRDDEIGNRLGSAVLCAAEKGVKVTISKDRFGVILEKAEECRKSFFHKEQTFGERMRTKTLVRFYKANYCPPAKDEESSLYRAVLSHPNITVEKDTVKKDHSKFYVIDERILYLGGINVEDKENGQDRQGRVYRDYMARLEGEDIVRDFWRQFRGGEGKEGDLRFCMNTRNGAIKRFEMEKVYLGMLARAKERILLTTAYLTCMPTLLNALVAAYERGVQVKVLFPENANLQRDSSMHTARKLKKRCPQAEIYLSPYMIHAKALIVDDEFCFGSANFNGCAFHELCELNLWGTRECGEFFTAFENSILENFALARKVTDEKQLSYRPLRARLEEMLG